MENETPIGVTSILLVLSLIAFYFGSYGAGCILLALFFLIHVGLQHEN